MKHTIFLPMMLYLLVLTACSRVSTQTGAATDIPHVVTLNPEDFTAVVDNPYLPRIPGTRYVYESPTDEGVERIEIEILTETREVMGITATVMRDTVYLNGEVIEDTFDWFAQGKNGDVWNLGEDVSNFKDGELVDKHGSWEAGVDGAQPGIVMFGDPAAHIGEIVRQEYYKGEAEDMTQILSIDEQVTIPFGSFENVVKMLDTTPLEPDRREEKYYAQGIGVIKTIDLGTGDEEILIVKQDHVPELITANQTRHLGAVVRSLRIEFRGD